MRKLFERALAKAEASTAPDSEQKIFAEIFGEQQYQREVMRLRHRSLLTRIKEWSHGSPTFTSSSPTRNTLDAKDGTPDEFGLGLDYAGLIFHSTGVAEDDAAWVVFNATKKTKAQSNASNLASQIPLDISTTQPPFRATAQDHTSTLPVHTPWTAVPLYTRTSTHIIPALIHHTAPQNGLWATQRSNWNRMWFVKHARELNRASAKEPFAALAVVRWEGWEMAWWASISRRGGVQAGEEWKDWKDVCGRVEGGVFGEG
jgi:hypothetical protein